MQLALGLLAQPCPGLVGLSTVLELRRLLGALAGLGERLRAGERLRTEVFGPDLAVLVADDVDEAAVLARLSQKEKQVDPKYYPRLRGDLDCIALKALEHERALRYASAAELAADLERHLNHLPVMASPPSVAYRVRKYVRRHRPTVIASVVDADVVTTTPRSGARAASSWSMRAL